MKQIILSILILFMFLTQSRYLYAQNVSTNLENKVTPKGTKLCTVFPFENIKEIWIQNWKGKHKLNPKQKQTCIEKLRNATSNGDQFQIKPGHLNFIFIMKDGKKYHAYGSNDLIIFEYNDVVNGEFQLEKTYNFENL